MLTLKKLLASGYFPTRLPPPFKTSVYASKLSTKTHASSIRQLFAKCPASRPANHNQARPGSLRRKLGIPNPINFWLFADFVVQNQQTIVAAASSSSISLTQPDISSPNRRRAIERKHDFDDLPGFRSRIRSTAGYILRSDVSRFYHSIYTHSISWALHTKPVANANRGKHSLLGNELDCFLRDMQDGQTLGVPIGPDTSFLIAELILAKVDEIMVGRGATHAFRYIDDYEFAFPDRASAERALADLQEAL